MDVVAHKCPTLICLPLNIQLLQSSFKREAKKGPSLGLYFSRRSLSAALNFCSCACSMILRCHYRYPKCSPNSCCDVFLMIWCFFHCLLQCRVIRWVGKIQHQKGNNFPPSTVLCWCWTTSFFLKSTASSSALLYCPKVLPSIASWCLTMWRSSSLHASSRSSHSLSKMPKEIWRPGIHT